VVAVGLVALLGHACVSVAHAADDGLTWAQIEQLSRVLVVAVSGGLMALGGLAAVVAKLWKQTQELTGSGASPEPKPRRIADDEPSLSALPWASTLALRDLETRLMHQIHALRVEGEGQHTRVNRSLQEAAADRLRLWQAHETLRSETQTAERATRDRDHAQAQTLGRIEGLLGQAVKGKN
jgi:hypothetical protein